MGALFVCFAQKIRSNFLAPKQKNTILPQKEFPKDGNQTGIS